MKVDLYTIRAYLLFTIMLELGIIVQWWSGSLKYLQFNSSSPAAPAPIWASIYIIGWAMIVLSIVFMFAFKHYTPEKYTVEAY